MYEEAFAAYKELFGKDEEILRAMEQGFTESGYAGVMFLIAETLAARVPEFDDYITLAKYYARADETESSLFWLEAAFERRQPQILHIKAMADFDALDSNPGYQDLLDRIGFPAWPSDEED